MAKPDSFKELEQQIESVLASESSDFFDLAAMLDFDPKQDFAGADLSGTDLSGKDFSDSNFTGTNLRGSDFSYAQLNRANFANANLSSPLLMAVAETVAESESINFSTFRVPRFGLIQSLLLSLERARVITRSLEQEREINRALERARDMALSISIARELNHVIDIEITRSIARDIGRVLTIVRDINLVMYSTHNIERDIDATYCQYLGTTFKGTDLGSAHWDEANLVGTLMIDCRGLTDENVNELKSRGVIFVNTTKRSDDWSNDVRYNFSGGWRGS